MSKIFLPSKLWNIAGNLLSNPEEDLKLSSFTFESLKESSFRIRSERSAFDLKIGWDIESIHVHLFGKDGDRIRSLKSDISAEFHLICTRSLPGITGLSSGYIEACKGETVLEALCSLCNVAAKVFFALVVYQCDSGEISRARLLHPIDHLGNRRSSEISLTHHLQTQYRHMTRRGMVISKEHHRALLLLKQNGCIDPLFSHCDV